MSERATAADRLARILYLVPAACRDDGVPLADLARRLGISEREVLRDIQEVTAREDYHPAGSVFEFTLFVEHDRLYTWTTGEFRRPTRLTPREALALGLGLRALAAEAEPARRAELLDLAERLEADLSVPEIESRGILAEMPSLALEEVDRIATRLADDEEDILSVIIEAARTCRVCRIRYLKPGAATPDDRVVHPYHLVHAEGRWYLLAHATDRGAVRIFRLDRILEAEPRAESFERPADFDPARYIAEGGRLFAAVDDVEVAVRYSPRIARWVEERAPCERREDGSVVVRHRVADPRWVVRHVLQYGAEAEVLEPVEVRGMVGEAVQRMLS